MTAGHSTSTIIRASEIGHYIYCRRAWWLGTVRGVRSENREALESGTRAHLRHGKMVASSQRWRLAGYALLVLGSAAAVLSLVLGAGGGL